MHVEVKLMADNLPGSIERYMLREVDYSPVVAVPVIVDGQCNHADYDLTDNNTSGPEDDSPVIKCNNRRCDAWKYLVNHLDDNWRDERFIENE